MPSIRGVLSELLLASLVSSISLASTRTVEIDTGEITRPDVAVAPDGSWLVFTALGHLIRLSTDGGTTWSDATVEGAAFSFAWAPAPGTYTVQSRVTDLDSIQEADPDEKIITIGSGPCSTPRRVEYIC